MPSMTPTVFLPCHTLDDFPTWLDEREADEVLAAWTAAWQPAIIAAAGRPPRWASLDLPPPDDGPLIGIVPAAFDDRFAIQAEGRAGHPDDRWVRGIPEADAVAAAAAACVPAGAGEAGDTWRRDFAALGLAVLLAELLARRMRSRAELEAADFRAAIVQAAEAAVAGRAADVTAAVSTCYRWLESSRARYYPADLWLIDLVLLAPATLGPALQRELAAPVPLGIVASADVLPAAAATHPDSLAALRAAVAAGRASICGGRFDERPLDACTPEELAASFAVGHTAWRDHVGAVPLTFAQATGGGSALLPQLLAGLGYVGVIWNRFDGTRLPDPGTARIRWEGTGGACIDGLARPPLDARSARTILELPDKLGDTIDHDHVAALTFAHHAGTASRWHDLLRLIGSQSGFLGTFVTPDAFFQRTGGTGTLVSYEPDAFPPTLPAVADPQQAAAAARAADDRVAAAVAQAAAEARRIVAASGELGPVAAPAAPVPAADVSPPAAARRGWWRRSEPRSQPLVLDNGLIRLQVHPGTGGILSLRRPADRGNRISQQLAVRGTRPQEKGGWLSVEDRAWHTRMQADAIAAADGIVSRGRLVDAAGRAVATFTQGMALAPGLPLATLDIDVELLEPLLGPALEQHLACRFAWHENEDVEVRRSVHTQSIVTERGRFTAPHFVEIVAAGGRAAAGRADAVAILTCGLPWHVLSLPHVLDTVLAVAGPQPLPAGTRLVRRVAVGVGLGRVSAAALEYLAAESAGQVGWGGVPTVVSGTARLTVNRVETAEERPVRARIGLLETAGMAGEVRIDWGRDVVAATARDLRGEPVPAAAVAVAGRSTVVFLRRYEWLHLDLEFA
jgi:hypothetical protein